MDSPWYSDRIMHAGRYCLPLSLAPVNVSFAFGRSLEMVRVKFPQLFAKREAAFGEDTTEGVSRVELHPFEPRHQFLQVRIRILRCYVGTMIRKLFRNSYPSGRRWIVSVLFRLLEIPTVGT